MSTAEDRGVIPAAPKQKKRQPSVRWKDRVARSIRFVPAETVGQSGSNPIYKIKTIDQTARAQARPLLPDEVDRELVGEAERDVPWACANRQHQNLALMTAEPCRSNPEHVRCCAEQLAAAVHREEMFEHDAQIPWLRAAASHILDEYPTGLPWKTIITGRTGESERRVVLGRER
jgi:hypothetical protein